MTISERQRGRPPRISNAQIETIAVASRNRWAEYIGNPDFTTILKCNMCGHSIYVVYPQKWPDWLMKVVANNLYGDCCSHTVAWMTKEIDVASQREALPLIIRAIK